MTNTLDIIKEPVREEFGQVHALISSLFSAEEQLLHQILVHISNKKGKQIRAIFTLLCAKLCGEINENVLRCSAAYEILHCGTLVHDDVVDETTVRRGQASVNALFDNRAAVLTGDYLLSCAMRLISDTGNAALMANLAELGKTLSCGELLQLQHSYTNITEEQYFNIIRKKTAILFTTCAQSAAIATNSDEEKRSALSRFSDLLGLCFQIKDDIIDYTPKNESGKPALNDIKEGKITLPLLYSLSKIEEKERQSIIQTIKDGKIDEQFNALILNIIEQNNGISYCYSKMEMLKKEAFNELKIFVNKEIISSLETLFDYVITRSK